MEEEKADKLNVPPYEDLNKDYSEEEIKNMINQVIYTDIKSLNNRLKVIEICLKIFWGNNILVKEYKTVFEKIKSKKDCELLNDLMDKRNAGHLYFLHHLPHFLHLDCLILPFDLGCLLLGLDYYFLLCLLNF